MTQDEPTREQWRAVPLDTLRAYVLTVSERSSLRAVAERSGIGRTTVLAFLNGTRPHPRIRRLLALWYLRETGGTQVDTDACEVLLSALPADRRGQAVAELDAFVRELHRAYGGGAE